MRQNSNLRNSHAPSGDSANKNSLHSSRKRNRQQRSKQVGDSDEMLGLGSYFEFVDDEEEGGLMAASGSSDGDGDDKPKKKKDFHHSTPTPKKKTLKVDIMKIGRGGTDRYFATLPYVYYWETVHFKDLYFKIVDRYPSLRGNCDKWYIAFEDVTLAGTNASTTIIYQYTDDIENAEDEPDDF